MRALRSFLLAVVLLAALPAAAVRGRPGGVQESTVWNGLVNPTRSSSPPTGACSWRRSAGGCVQLRLARRPDADRVRRPLERRCTTSGTAACSGWRSTRTSRTGGRTSTCSTRTTRTRPTRRSRAGPTAARRRRARPATAASSPAGSPGSAPAASETPLITDWCQQYPSHSVGDLVFGPGRALYVSAGDGASFNFADYGQDGAPVNPCGDPGGAAPTPPTAEGGALRAQDVRTRRRPDRRRRRDPARRPRHRRRAARQPGRRQRRPDDPADRRARLPQPVPADAAPRHQRGLGRATSAGTSGRRSTASPRRPRASATSAGPATRARAGWAPTTT